MSERLADRCGFDTSGRTFAIPGPDEETWLAAADLGQGEEVAVLVHQTGSAALCGWLPYAEWASRHGVRVLLVDACWYGESVCSEAVRDDAAAWLGSAVAWVRQEGASRVTLVGASMGGSIVTAVGQELGVDAIVNLSGPSHFTDVRPVLPSARTVRVPFLAAAAASDDGISPRALRRAVAVAPSRVSRYVAAPEGHGYTMLTANGFSNDPADTRPTALGRLVLRWLQGEVG
jgi:dienelactone hydrolase